jgi:hypothetical protein
MKSIRVPHKDLVEAIREVQEGKFHPDGENDELTKALKNKEHPGRTRGLGATVPCRISLSGTMKLIEADLDQRSERKTSCRS